MGRKYKAKYIEALALAALRLINLPKTGVWYFILSSPSKASPRDTQGTFFPGHVHEMDLATWEMIEAKEVMPSSSRLLHDCKIMQKSLPESTLQCSSLMTLDNTTKCFFNCPDRVRGQLLSSIGDHIIITDSLTHWNNVINQFVLSKKSTV